MYITSLAMSRFSLLLQLIRLAPSPRSRIFIWVLFGVSGTFGVLAFFLQAFQCSTHPSSFWKSFEKLETSHDNEKTCVDFISIQVYTAAVNIVIDFLVWIAPLKLIWQVRLPNAQKIGLFVAFGLGAMWGIPSLRLLDLANDHHRVWISAISRTVEAEKTRKTITNRVGAGDPTCKSLSVALLAFNELELIEWLDDAIYIMLWTM